MFAHLSEAWRVCVRDDRRSGRRDEPERGQAAGCADREKRVRVPPQPRPSAESLSAASGMLRDHARPTASPSGQIQGPLISARLSRLRHRRVSCVPKAKQLTFGRDGRRGHDARSVTSNSSQEECSATTLGSLVCLARPSLRLHRPPGLTIPPRLRTLRLTADNPLPPVCAHGAPGSHSGSLSDPCHGSARGLSAKWSRTDIAGRDDWRHRVRPPSVASCTSPSASRSRR